VKDKLPYPFMSAEEFCKLLDRAIFSDNEKDAVIARKELEKRSKECDQAKHHIGESPESKN